LSRPLLSSLFLFLLCLPFLLLLGQLLLSLLSFLFLLLLLLLSTLTLDPFPLSPLFALFR
jgi:hypothetical protein